MSPLSQGTWGIESVVVNSETVMIDDGFEQLCVSDRKIMISPIGLSFNIVEATESNLILMSQEQVYFADFEQSSSAMNLKLTRPEFTETIEINARVRKNERVTVEREVVQV